MKKIKWYVRRQVAKALYWIERKSNRARHLVERAQWVYVPDPNRHLGQVALAGDDSEGK